MPGASPDTSGDGPGRAVPEVEAEPPPSGALELTVDIVGLEGGWLFLESVEKRVLAAAQAVARHRAVRQQLPAEVCIALASDVEVEALNRGWRGKDRSTNILSFPAPPYPAQGGSPPFLGDVILARETVLAEADEQGIAPPAHIQHLVVHGLLHLLGFDHETEGMALEMEAMETEILASIGVADPYAMS